MPHCMFDIETVGLRPGCAVRSVAVAAFMPGNPKPAERFHVNIDVEDCKTHGLWLDPETEAFWKKKGAVAEIKGGLPLRDALIDFSAWCREQGFDRYWANGICFDAPILDRAFYAVRLAPPWRHFELRDTQTVLDMAQFDIRELKREPGYHNAISNVTFQIESLAGAIARMRQLLAPKPAGVFG
jgi:hypothetical protein